MVDASVSRFDGASKAAEEIKTRLSRALLAEKGKGKPASRENPE